jgi:Protein of unknown function DUF262/Protein of unknown function (DUF1524)
MPAKIQGYQLPVEKIFSDDFCFSIPLYQRPYSWTTEEAGELLDDLLVFLNSSQQDVDNLDPYFLGSIVLIKEDGIAESEVIDGQQRLTTLTILLSALRSLVPIEFSNGLREFIYEKGNVVRGTPNRYRLTLRQRDAEFFKTHVQDEDGLAKLRQLNVANYKDSKLNIIQNSQLYLKKFGEFSEANRTRLAQFIIKRCFLVIVSTPDFDAAYRIFSVLNDRGMDLSHTDILKSEIIGKIPEAQQDHYGKKWETIEESLGRETFKELFNHIRMIARKAKPKESILKEIREFVKPAERPAKFIDMELEPLAEAFSTIKSAAYVSTKLAQEINDCLKWLNRIDNVDWQPPVVLYFTKFHSDPDALLKFVRDLERLASGLLVYRADTNERIDRYGKLIASIESDADLYEPASPLQLTPTEITAILEKLNGDLYLQKKVVLYVLLYVDSLLTAGGGATYEVPVTSVEHVLPQNPKAGSKWLQWFPDEQVRIREVHRLGNLVLLSRRKNTEALNYDFDTKKQKYFVSKNGTSPFALTSQVLAENEWTQQVLDRRQDNLLARLRSAWRL